MLRTILLAAATAVLVLVADSDLAAQGSSARYEGEIEVLVVEDLSRGEAETQVFLREKTSGRRIRLQLDGPTGQLSHGRRVRLRGVERGGVLEVDAVLYVSPAAPPAGAAAVSGGYVAGASAGAPGAAERRAVVLMVDLVDAFASQRWTLEEIADTMYTGERTVDGLYLESSAGQLGFAPDTDGDGLVDVFGPFQVGHTGASCDYTTWAVEADVLAEQAGIDLDLYTHRVYVLPHKQDTACTWTGLAHLGCAEFCRAWIGNASNPIVFAHELGHNLGLSHASSDLDNDGQKDAEYGDASAVMGRLYGWHRFNAPHADQLGWFDIFPGDVVTATGDGVYTLWSMSADPGSVPSPKVLKIRKPDTGEDYYLSVRQAIGYDDGLSPSYLGGACLHRFPGGSERSYYIRTLGDGEIFVDAPNDIRVTQLAHAADGSWAQVSVDVDCTQNTPLAGIGPAVVSASTGELVSFVIALKSSDSYFCPPRAFLIEVSHPLDVGGYVEESWGALAPGEVKYTRFHAVSFGPEGSYPIGLVVNGVPRRTVELQVGP